MTEFKSTLQDSTVQLNNVEKYKITEPKYTIMRTIPEDHFKIELTGQGEEIEFLPNLKIFYKDNVISSNYKIYLKITSVRPSFTPNQNYRQITAFFDLSSRPIGCVLKQPIEIQLKLSNQEVSDFDEQNHVIILQSFDYNTRKWNEIETQYENGIITTKIQHFGKFCFIRKPKLTEFLLSEVATRHVISSTETYSTQLILDNDVIKNQCSLVSVSRHKISNSNVKRASDSIGIKNAKIEEIYNIKIGNSIKSDGKSSLSVVYVPKPRENETNDGIVIVGLKLTNNGIWQVHQGDTLELTCGDQHKICFIETDAGTAQDDKKLSYFGSELDFVMKSSVASIFIYQNLVQLNKVHVGFFEKYKDHNCWNLIASNRDIVLQESSKVQFSVDNANILTEDNSPKTLIFFKNNKTGLTFYTIKKNRDPININIAVTDSVTKQLGIVLTGTLAQEHEKSTGGISDFDDYICVKKYQHVESPSIIREYKLQWLKYLSPAEREKYRSINGI